MRVAAAHVAPVFMDTTATIEKAISWIQEAAKQGIDLLAFPEVFTPGYPYFIDCYPPRPMDKVFARYAAASIEATGPELAAVRAAARQAGVAVVLGMSERLSGTHTIFNSQAFIDRDGSLAGVHRKLQPTYAERMVWAQGGGATLKVHQMQAGRVGGLICYENTMNLARQSLIEQHQQIHVAAWPSLSTLPGLDATIDSQIEALAKAQAICGQTFVIVVANPIDQSCLDWMEREIGPQEDVRLGGGWSAIVHPQTTFVTPPHTGPEEKLVVGDIDLDEVAQLKVWVDGAGHYSRPEVVRMETVTRPLWHDEVEVGQRVLVGAAHPSEALGERSRGALES